MSRPRQNAFWPVARRVFRWCRIAILFLVLALIVVLIWLNQVGLPDFLKRRLVVALQSNGIDLHFASMRLHWYRGIVADRIYFGRPSVTNAPQVFANQAELRLDRRALLGGDLRVSGVGLRGGRMTVPVWGTNDTPHQIEVEAIHGQVKLLPGDRWELTGFSAKTFGVKLLLAGAITNGSAIQTWKIASEKRPRPRSAAAFWYDFIEQLERSTFEPPSEIVGQVFGDARNPQSFRASLQVSSPAVESPWGRGRDVSLNVQLAPATSSAFTADARLQAREVSTRWGEAASLDLDARIAPSFTRWTPTNAQIVARISKARSPWARAANVSVTATFQPNPADPDASIAEYLLRAQQVETKFARAAQTELHATAVLTSSNLWPTTTRATVQFAGGDIAAGRAASGRIDASLRLPSFSTMRFGETNLSWWARLDQVEADTRAVLSDVRAQQIEARTLALSADWKPPRLAVRDFKGTFLDGELLAAAALHTGSRELTATLNSSFDPRRLAPLLSTNAIRWLDQYTWDKPPLVDARARVVLPVWTNQPVGWDKVDWGTEVQPTLAIEGEFQVGSATYRAVPMTSARSFFVFSNFTWRLPNIVITRPEGQVRLAHVADTRTRRFEFSVDSGIDPRALGPLLGPDERKVLDEFEFTAPPVFRGEIAGRWRAEDELTIRADIAGTNFVFRKQPVNNFRTALTLTNQMLVFAQPEVQRSEGSGRADEVRVDLRREILFINNARGRLDPRAVTIAVGEDVAATMEPYQFSHPPDARVHGVITLQDFKGTDILFQVAGGPFQWKAFRFQQITGVVHWLDNGVTLSNLVGSFHAGTLEATAAFNFDVREGADFSFRTLVSEVNLQSLVEEVGGHTNRVEGTLHGLLVITNGNSENARTWDGYGNLTVQDGLLWDFPIFGIFSPVLNAIKPGAGNTRAKEASATFGVTNGTIYSSDLAIHASGMRLKYSGMVDFDARVKGRMEAQLFRDTPGLGPLVSTVLWPVTKLFEYRIAGTLSKPEAEPLYIPKILTAPFHPLRTLRELMPDQKYLPGAPVEPER